MLSKLLRGLALLAYALLLLAVFGLAAYTSFSLFVRSGVTTVPSVTGLSRAEAATALADQGLEPSGFDGEGRYDDKVPAGHVARQNPDPRTLVKRGSRVTVALSKGPRRAEVPELAGKTLPAAQQALSGAGLALGRLLGGIAPAGTPAGSVFLHDPDPGDEITPSTPVDLLLALPESGERYIMPDLVYRDYDLVRPLFERGGFRFGSVKFERYEGVSAGTILRQYPLPGHPLTKEDAVSLVVATADAPTEGPSLRPSPPAPPPADGAGTP